MIQNIKKKKLSDFLQVLTGLFWFNISMPKYICTNFVLLVNVQCPGCAICVDISIESGTVSDQSKHRHNIVYCCYNSCMTLGVLFHGCMLCIEVFFKQSDHCGFFLVILIVLVRLLRDFVKRHKYYLMLNEPTSCQISLK